jgi:diguanylate cyclase (GGDEF)-like protein
MGQFAHGIAPRGEGTCVLKGGRRRVDVLWMGTAETWDLAVSGRAVGLGASPAITPAARADDETSSIEGSRSVGGSAPATPVDEAARLAELRSLGLLDTDPEERFDRVTRLAQRLFDVPIALVSLVDHDRQWFKSRQGLDATETPRDISFCGHAILDNEVLHVSDATRDPRFADNPLVQGEPRIRFYAGCPIVGPSGTKIGTLCIIDRSPRSLSERDTASLRDLAGMVEQELAALALATVDQLTGLANRRGFEQAASQILQVCQRQGAHATLLYADLDGFKSINDRYGHDEGDRALVEFARLLEETFRTSDVIARLSGDEFAVLLTGTPDAKTAAERLRYALDARNETSDRPYFLDASVGSSTLAPHDHDSIADLLQRADASMYAVKRSK